MAMKIRTGDQVIVISGSSKGCIGKVTSVSNGKAILDNNINMRTKSIRKKKDEPGRRESFPAPIDLSNLAHVIDNKPVRVGFQVCKEGKFIVSKNNSGTRIRKV